MPGATTYREVKSSLSDGKTLVRDGKEAERALMDRTKMMVPGRRMQDISSRPTRGGEQLAAGEVRRVGPH